MVFSNFTRTTLGNQILFKNSVAIEYVTLLKFYQDNAAGAFSKKELRWSFNNSYWSSWTPLNQGNLSNIDIKGNRYLFLEVRYIVSGSGTVTRFTVTYTASSVTPTTPVVPITPITAAQQIAASAISGPVVVGTGKIFSTFTRTEAGNQILFKNVAPIRGVEALTFYRDNATGSFSKKELRWSFNNNYWSAWTPLNQGNLTNIDIKGNLYLYLEIRYVVSGTGTVTTFSVNYTATILQPIETTTEVTETETIFSKIINIYDDVYDSDTLPQPEPINAGTLNTFPGAFYLWRPNHKGKQSISTITGLQDILNYKLTWGFQNIDYPGDASIFSYEDSNIAYFKKLIGGEGAEITEDVSTITITLDASIVSKYISTFDATGFTSKFIPASTHKLGIGPFNISVYEGTDRVYTDIDVSNGDVTLEWTSGALIGTCKFIIVGGVGESEGPNPYEEDDYGTYEPFVGDVSFSYTGDLITQITTLKTQPHVGTKIVNFIYDLNGDVSVININKYGKMSRVVTFEKDVDENIIAIHIV